MLPYRQRITLTWEKTRTEHRCGYQRGVQPAAAQSRGHGWKLVTKYPSPDATKTSPATRWGRRKLSRTDGTCNSGLAASLLMGRKDFALYEIDLLATTSSAALGSKSSAWPRSSKMSAPRSGCE